MHGAHDDDHSLTPRAVGLQHLCDAVLACTRVRVRVRVRARARVRVVVRVRVRVRVRVNQAGWRFNLTLTKQVNPTPNLLGRVEAGLARGRPDRAGGGHLRDGLLLGGHLPRHHRGYLR